MAQEGTEKQEQDFFEQETQENTFNQVIEETPPNQENTKNEDSSASASDPLESLTYELAEAKDKYLRLYAEFENFRRRSAKERVELIGTATSDLMKELLSVLDDFDRAKISIDKASEIASVKEGVDLIYAKLYSILEKKGLKPMTTKQLDFDADTMEAITQIAAGDEMKNKVVDEVEKGYYLHDKIIRYAKVVIGQ